MVPSLSAPRSWRRYARRGTTCKQCVAYFAHRAVPAAQPRDLLCGGVRVAMRIGWREAAANGAQHRYVCCVVPHRGTLGQRYPQSFADLFQASEFVIDTLKYMSNVQFAAATQRRGRAPPRNDCDRHTAGLQRLDTLTVPHMKHFERLAARAVVQPPIRQHTVDVEY